MIKVSIAENLEDVEKRISAAAKRSGRKREDITACCRYKNSPCRNDERGYKAWCNGHRRE